MVLTGFIMSWPRIRQRKTETKCSCSWPILCKSPASSTLLKVALVPIHTNRPIQWKIRERERERERKSTGVLFNYVFAQVSQARFYCSNDKMQHFMHSACLSYTFTCHGHIEQGHWALPSILKPAKCQIGCVFLFFGCFAFRRAQFTKTPVFPALCHFV